jgi:hypothetical protein
LYNAGFEGENEYENVTGRPLSMFLEDFGDLDASDDQVSAYSSLTSAER